MIQTGLVKHIPDKAPTALLRLNLTAKRLPRKLVKVTVGKMKGNLAAIIKTEVATAPWTDAPLALLMLQLHIDLECPVAGRPLVNENMKT